jgi:hypothetical protein
MDDSTHKVASRYLKTALLSEGQWAAKQIEECLETLEGVVVTLEARGRSGDYEADASVVDTYKEAADAVKLIRHKVSADLDKAAKWLKKIR